MPQAPGDPVGDKVKESLQPQLRRDDEEAEEQRYSRPVDVGEGRRC